MNPLWELLLISGIRNPDCRTVFPAGVVAYGTQISGTRNSRKLAFTSAAFLPMRMCARGVENSHFGLVGSHPVSLQFDQRSFARGQPHTLGLRRAGSPEPHDTQQRASRSAGCRVERPENSSVCMSC